MTSTIPSVVRTAPPARRAQRVPLRLSSPVVNRLGQVPALEGVRGIALLGVLVFHLAPLRMFEPRWLPGGDLGVELFFVLSGFLITALLLKERSDTGRIHLWAFWGRRFLRLVPPLVVLLFAHAIYAQVESLDPVAESNSAISALFYFFNWRMLWGWVGNNDVGHLWSLSIEEQFYVFWPLIVTALVLLRTRVTWMVALLVAVIVGITLHWLRLADLGVTEFFLGIRTDVRVDGLIMGCLAAVLWAYGLVPRRGLSTLATLSAAFMAYAFWKMPSDIAYYRWWELVFSFATAVVIVAATEGRWFGTTPLTFKPLRAVGRVSYGLYLWHLPAILLVFRHAPRASETRRIALALAITAAGTLLSWYLVERPLNRVKSRLHPSGRNDSGPPGPSTTEVTSATAAPAKT